jgi:long-chain acyl-CoA synthetase
VDHPRLDVGGAGKALELAELLAIGIDPERLAAHKYPREVRILDALPLTSVGKLDRKGLRARAPGG